MSFRAPRRPWWIFAASMLAWAACTFVVVRINGDSDAAQWLREASSTMGAGFAAGVVGSGLVGWWEGRERRWSERRPAFALMTQAATDLANLAHVVDKAIMEAAPPQVLVVVRSAKRVDAEDLFALPVTKLQADIIDEQVRTLEDQIVGAMDSPAAPTERQREMIRDAVIQGSGSLAGIADATLQLLLLGEDTHTTALRSASESLTATARESFKLASLRDEHLPAVMLIADWGQVARKAADLLTALGDVYNHVRDTTSDPWLRARFTEHGRSHSLVVSRLQGAREIHALVQGVMKELRKEQGHGDSDDATRAPDAPRQ
jgi:hypothetical protein